MTRTRGYFDIETTGLDPVKDVIITNVTVVEEIDDDGLPTSEPATMKLEWIGDDFPDDLDLARRIRDELASHDEIVGWFSHGFDLPRINTKLRLGNERQLVHRGSFDLKAYCKEKFPYIDGHLDSFAKALDLPYQKTEFDPVIWHKATMEDDTKSWNYIIDHNVLDVKATRLIYHRLVLGLDPK